MSIRSGFLILDVCVQFLPVVVRFIALRLLTSHPRRQTLTKGWASL